MTINNVGLFFTKCLFNVLSPYAYERKKPSQRTGLLKKIKITLIYLREASAAFASSKGATTPNTKNKING